MPKEWVVSPPHERAAEMAVQLGVSRVTAQVLANRGVTDADAARRFMNPRMNELLPPESVPGAMQAARRIVAAVRAQQRIVIYGDYDVDGVTGVAILWHCIRAIGGQADYYVPHRLEEGYGLNTAAIEKLIADGAQLIISVDCGITAIEPAAAARRLGCPIIITDHHQPLKSDSGEPLLPDADVIVHPGLGDAPANADLCGAGVAMKLAWAIGQEVAGGGRVSAEFREFLLTATALAALGLVADVVPLTGENRVLALHGLRGLAATPHHGVQALIESAGLTGRKLGGCDVGFLLAPRLNAIGRMGHARLAVELLTRAEPDEAKRIAQNLEEQNRKRQSLERRITSEARQMAVDAGMTGDGSRAIALCSEGWHAGVIGIVASRLVDEFHRPTVLAAMDNGSGQGSARSIRHFPLHEALSDCREHLITFGGHAMAAGLKVARDRWDGFVGAFQQRAAQRLTAADLRPSLRIDAECAPAELVEPLVRELAALEPFGMGNAEPRFSTGWLEVCGEPRAVGSKGDHLQIALSGGGTQRKAIGFGMAKHRDTLCDKRRCRVAFRPVLNEWNGRRSVEMQLLDIQFPD